eukprot:689252-Hanusia_phi.AAC.2
MVLPDRSNAGELAAEEGVRAREGRGGTRRAEDRSCLADRKELAPEVADPSSDVSDLARVGQVALHVDLDHPRAEAPMPRQRLLEGRHAVAGLVGEPGDGQHHLLQLGEGAVEAEVDQVVVLS